MYGQKKIEGKEKKYSFSNCEIPSVITEGRLMAINDKFLVLPWQKPGYINIVDSKIPCNLSLNNNCNLFKTDYSNILDMEFSPFNSNVLAFCNENNSVILSYISEEKNHFNQSNCYKNHNNKVNFVNFNPIVSNLMCSGTTSGDIHIWDSLKMKTIHEYKSSNPNSIFWSPNGNLIGISTKSKYFYVYEPRQKKYIFSQQISKTMNTSKFAWMDNDSIATIGWNINGHKYLYLYSLKKSEKPYYSILIDKSNSTAVPFVDQELKLIYTVGKEESYIGAYDYSLDEPKKCLNFLCTETNYFSLLLNRKYLDKYSKEIDRLVRFTKTKKIFYISFCYKNQGFESEQVLYPNEMLNKPQLTTDQWIAGKSVQNIQQVIYQRKISNSSNINKDIVNSDDIQNKYENNNNNDGITFSKNNNFIQPKDNNNIKKFININTNTHKTNQPIKIYSNNQNLSHNLEKTENECNNCIKLKNQISQLEIEKNKLSNEFSSRINNNQFQIEQDKYKDEINKLKSENNKIKNSSDKLISSVTYLKQNLEKEIKEKEEINKKYNNLLKSNNSVNEEKLFQQQIQIQELKESLQNYQKKYSDKKAIVNQLNNDKEELKKKYSDLVNKYNSLIMKSNKKDENLKTFEANVANFK